MNTACLLICLWAKNPHPNEVDIGKNKESKMSLRHFIGIDSYLKVYTNQPALMKNL